MRNKVIEQAKAWLGYNESDGSHKKIIDVYNAHKPLARGYKVTYTDAWCATFVSAVAIQCGLTDVIPTECGCNPMINLFKKMNAWDENDARVPNPGDIIFYDWQDTGAGDNTGSSDHVGIVEKVENGKITIIEGNCSNAVKRRILNVNGKYIRGYGVPKYNTEVKPEPVPEVKPEPATKSVKATDYARSFLKSFAGTYKVTASWLNIRHGAGITKKGMVQIPNGTVVKCYGYYTNYLGTPWLYIQFTYKGVSYTGFASSKYLKK